MHFVVLTLFKEMVETIMNTSIMGRALDKGLISLDVIDIRDYAENKHNRVDDYPYGGGAGMVMQAGPVYKAPPFPCNISRSTNCLWRGRSTSGCSRISSIDVFNTISVHTSVSISRPYKDSRPVSPRIGWIYNISGSWFDTLTHPLILIEYFYILIVFIFFNEISYSLRIIFPTNRNKIVLIISFTIFSVFFRGSIFATT